MHFASRRLRINRTGLIVIKGVGKMAPVLAAFLLLLTNQSLLAVAQHPLDAQPQSFSKQILDLNGEQITIIRDSFGVPHVLASTERGVYYGGGYAVAQDRLYQLERFRRDAHGEIAEIEGREAFNRDAVTKSFAYTEEQLQAAYDSFTEQIKQCFQAYSDGINAFIREAIRENKVPEAFKKAGLEGPAPWKVSDSIAIAVMMSRRFGSSGGAEILNAQVLKRLKEKFGDEGEGIFNDLLWLNDPKSPTTIPDEGKSAPAQMRKRKVSTFLPIDRLSDTPLREAIEMATQASVLDYSAAHGLPAKWGSYCWVISPRRSASGSAFLVGGPEMGFSTPQIGHEIHYSTPSLNIIGMAVAGVPVVLVGHNDRLAWSMTSGLTDMVDIFAERLNPKNRNQYFYKGSYRDMQERVNKIKVKGEKTKSIVNYRTVHGLVVSWDEKAGIAYSYGASYEGKEVSTIEALFGFNHATNLQEFAKAAELIYTSQNVLVATVDGDIAYWHCGKPPIRAPGHDPRLPPPGTGEYDWQGLMSFPKMPHVINPEQGYLINWNNKPARWWDNGDTSVWGEVFQMRHVEELIKAQPKLTFEQVRDIAREIANDEAGTDYLKPYLLAAVERTVSGNTDKRIGQASDILRAWDNRAVDGSVGKTIFDAWYQVIQELVFGQDFKELRGIALLFGARQYYSQLVQQSLLLHIFEGRKSGLPTSRDYLKGKSKDEVIIEALKKALDELTTRRGPQMNLWAYKQEKVNFDPLPGLPEVTSRGTYILCVELSKPLFRSVSVLPPGQSEDPRSPHYGDQRELAGYWQFKPILYKREQLDGTRAGGKPGGN